MKPAVWIPLVLLLSISAGTLADRVPVRRTIEAGGYRILSGDFHLHSGLGSGGSLTPWGLVAEAQRQGLDVVALTGHNETWDGRVARVFSRLTDGPIVLVGEEVTSRSQDLVAIGLEATISPRLSLREQIEEVHRQGGLAIAAHPVAEFHAPYESDGAISLIDGAEVCHPVIYERATAAMELASFLARTQAAPIGSSDFHSSGRLGSCRTFIFAEEATDRAVLDAIRAGRTVVYGYEGRPFGKPDLVRLADDAGLRTIAEGYTRARGSWLDWVSRIAAGAALIAITVATRFRAIRLAAGFRGSDPPGRAQFP